VGRSEKHTCTVYPWKRNGKEESEHSLVRADSEGRGPSGERWYVQDTPYQWIMETVMSHVMSCCSYSNHGNPMLCVFAKYPQTGDKCWGNGHEPEVRTEGESVTGRGNPSTDPAACPGSCDPSDVQVPG
jgi:hypothetical protein